MTVITPEQHQQWKSDGYLLLPGFYSAAEAGEMLARARELLDEFKIEGHPLTTFKTEADGEHVGDDYFLNSGDKIRYFLEPSSLSTATAETPAKLLVPPAQSINKIGHALAILDPVFRRHTLESSKIKDLAMKLGEQTSPRVLQSMIICKQPRIGAQVPCHNDSTFLYTNPPSAIGAWVALEDCTPQNGCLSFLPGSHRLSRTSSRFVRQAKDGGVGTGFEDVPGVQPNTEKWDEMEGWRQEPCPAGTLVLIHGSVMHKSPPNTSDKSRLIYTFHMIEGANGVVYDDKNWLQPTPDMPFPALF
ncbi:phytanoyl-CoA hydroxylase, partial [Tremellales sp. Uapishka_1]